MATKLNKVGNYFSDIIIGNSIKLAQGKKFCLDTDLDTYIYCSGDDLIHINTGNNNRLLISNTTTIINNDLLIQNGLQLGIESGLSGATPAVTGYNSFLVTNLGAVTITDFTLAVESQIIHLRFANANTTITDGTNIMLSGGANKNFGTDDMCVLVKRGSVWYQVGGVI